MRGTTLCALGALLVLWTAGCEKTDLGPEARAKRLGERIRCPVCRGVPISESPAALAKEMMEVVRQQVSEGKSDEEVLKFFEERYGEWALLDPKPTGMNLIIWILPLALLVGGSAFIVWWVRRRGPA